MPLDETAITPNRKADADELPPFEVPMRRTPNGWTRIQPQIDTTGRNSNWQTESRVNHLEGSNEKGFGQWDKVWPAQGQSFFDSGDVAPNLEKTLAMLQAEDQKSTTTAAAV